MAHQSLKQQVEIISSRYKVSTRTVYKRIAKHGLNTVLQYPEIVLMRAALGSGRMSISRGVLPYRIAGGSHT